MLHLGQTHGSPICINGVGVTCMNLQGGHRTMPRAQCWFYPLLWMDADD
jgi:hypothetical protein